MLSFTKDKMALKDFPFREIMDALEMKWVPSKHLRFHGH